MANPVDVAIEKFGSLANMARQLEVSHQVIQGWRKQARVPPQHCPRIERLLEGAVRCEQLNDDIDWAYLRTTEPATNSS
jgi:DNA-binding transcriptional regulator YdaS (Cro superfamily)